MSYAEAKAKYLLLGVDTDAAIAKLKTVPVSLHCWQGDDVRGFDTDPTKPLTGGIQTTGNYPGKARTPQQLMEDMEMAMSLMPGKKKLNLHACYAIFEDGELDFLSIYTIQEFIKNRLNNSLENIGLDRIFEVDSKEIEKTIWFDEEVLSTKHTDFFYKR